MTLDQYIKLTNEDEHAACDKLLSSSNDIISLFQSEEDLIYFFERTNSGLVSFQLFSSFNDKVANLINSVAVALRVAELATHFSLMLICRKQQMRDLFQKFDDFVQLLTISRSAGSILYAKDIKLPIPMQYRANLFSSASISHQFLRLAQSEKNSSMDWTIRLLKNIPSQNIEMSKLNQLWDMMYANPKLKVYQIERLQRRFLPSPLKFSGIFHSKATLADIENERLGFSLCG